MGFVLRAASQSQSATRRRPLNAMSSKAQQRPFGAWSTHQQSQQTPLFCFLCVVEPVELQFFWVAAMPTHGRSGVRTMDLLYRTRQRYPYSNPPKYSGRAHWKLMQTASPARQWWASSPPFFAHVSPPAGAYNALKFFMFLLNDGFAHTITTLWDRRVSTSPPGLRSPQQGKPLSALAAHADFVNGTL